MSLLRRPAQVQPASPPQSVIRLSVSANYHGAHDTRVVANLRMHVWTDADPMHQMGEPYAPRGTQLWQEIRGLLGHVEIDHGNRPAAYVYVTVHDDRAADDDESVAVPGERRAQAVVHMSKLLCKEPFVANLVVPEAGGFVMGTVAITLTSGSWIPHGQTMKKALRKGAMLAAVNFPIKGVQGLTTGMRMLDTSYWNDPSTKLPGWTWMLNMPRAPEHPVFVEAILGAAAVRRGISPERLRALAAVALADAAGTEQACPSDDTLRFATLVAEAYHLAVTTARYLTDTVDSNKEGTPWRSRLLKPVENMTAGIRESRADDCEGFAAGLGSLMYGTVHGIQDAAYPIHAAARAMLRCWLPLVTLGQATRTSEDPSMSQYNTGDGLNAHSWFMLIPTSAARTCMASRNDPNVGVVLDPMMLHPWKVGLPVFLVDGTVNTEHYPRSWKYERGPRTFAHAMSENSTFVSCVRAHNPSFHRVVRNAFAPYGVRAAGDPSKRAIELYWYGGNAYCCPVMDVFRLPHTPPPGFNCGPPPPSTNPGSLGAPWLAASTIVSADDLAQLRPALAAMHPVRPAPVDDDPEDAQRVLSIACAALKKVGVSFSAQRPPSNETWGIPTVITIKWSDAIRPDRMLAFAYSVHSQNKSVYVWAQKFWGRECQLWAQSMDA